MTNVCGVSWLHCAVFSAAQRHHRCLKQVTVTEFSVAPGQFKPFFVLKDVFFFFFFIAEFMIELGGLSGSRMVQERIEKKKCALNLNWRIGESAGTIIEQKCVKLAWKSKLYKCVPGLFKCNSGAILWLSNASLRAPLFPQCRANLLHYSSPHHAESAWTAFWLGFCHPFATRIEGPWLFGPRDGSKINWLEMTSARICHRSARRYHKWNHKP